MAKNEAKIRFTAETGEFNDQIKKSNDEMSKLRAEMKLNDEQMKSTGTSVEGLQQRQKLLTEQLTASQAKTEALSQKVQKAKEIYGENSAEVQKLQTQLINAQTAEVKIERALTSCNTALRQQAEAANRVETETEKLSGAINDQQQDLNKLKREYVEAVLKYGETSDEARELGQGIDSLSDELKENKKAMKQATDAADELDNSLDDVEDHNGEGFTVFKGALADLVSNGIQAAISKVNEFTDYLFGLSEATREIRQDFATLNTAFENVGLSTEEATNTWKELYKVFGEDDRAVEASNNIARMSKNQQDLDKWVTITTGIWGTYQDALPVEGLAEAAGETAKTGQVTGVLADALNWSSEAAGMFADYMSEDVTTAEDAFNVALTNCTTEQERQALITDTLTKLYGGAADTYRETSGAMLEAKEATAENILAENEMATAIEPLTTEWNNITNELKVGFLPIIQSVSTAMLDAMVWLQEHPVLLKVLAGVLGVVATALGVLTVATIAQTAAQWALNSAVLANPLTWIIVGIVAAIAAVVAIIVLLIEYWDEIVASVQTALQAVGQFFSDLWTKITEIWGNITEFFATIGQWVYDNIIAPVAQFFVDLWNGIVNAYHTVIDPWIEIFTKIATYVKDNIIQPILEFFGNLWEDIKNVFATAWEWFDSTVIQPVVNVFANMWNGLKDGAKNAWEGVKSVFSKVSTFFGDIFREAWQKVKDVFSTGGKIFDGIKEGITNVFKTVVNAIIKGINKVVSIPFKGFNKVLDKLYNLSILGVQPFAWLTWRAPIPEIPLMKEGGILTQPTLNVAGEAGPEAIIPLDKLYTYISGAVERTMQSDRLYALIEAVEDLASRPIDLSINGQKFATATAGDTDAVSGGRMALSRRGLAL